MKSNVDAADRDRWNRIYSSGSHTSLAPDSFFVEAFSAHIQGPFMRPHRSAPGSELPGSGPLALDIAGGVGRHALWLAARGWRVVLNDLSDRAARLAEENARRAAVQLTIRTESAAATLQWAAAQELRFDLILVLFYLERSLFPVLSGALAHGGMLLIKTRTEDHPRFTTGSHHPEYFLRAGELAPAFPRLRVLHSREQDGMAELLVQAA